MKPAEFMDFSGGITDKDIPGLTNKYSIGNNLLIDSDKRLYSRDGFDIFSSTAYQLSAAERAARLVNFNNDSELLAFQNKKALAISGGAWTEVTGPNGLSAFPSNTAASLIEETQWNSHVYLASDSGDPVIKMYRDGSNVMQLRTAGLPAFGLFTGEDETLTPADGGLALAITLANDLRTQMIAHYGSNGAAAGTVETVSTKSHTSHADLAAQASAVSASTPATNLASLIALVNVLRAQYSLHMVDAQLEENPIDVRSALPFKRNYHVKPAAAGTLYRLHDCPNDDLMQPGYNWVHYLNMSVEDKGYTLASTIKIAELLPYLNDLREKWNWHQYSTLTHYNAWRYLGVESYTQLAVHATSVARVEPYTWAKITPGVGPFVQYVKDIKAEFDAHRVSGSHHQSDTVTAVPASYPTTPTTLYEAITLLGVLLHEIYHHVFDTQTGVPFEVTADTTSGSPTLSNMTVSIANQYRDLWCLPIIGTGSSPYSWAIDYSIFTRGTSYRITANAVANATMANNAIGTIVGARFIFAYSFFHLGAHSGTFYESYDPYALNKAMNNLDYRFISAASLQGLSDVAKSLIDLLKAHELDKRTVVPAPSSSVNKYTTYNGRQYDRYAITDVTDASGWLITPHSFISTEPNGLAGYAFFPVAAASGSDFAQTHFETVANGGTQPAAVSVNYRMDFRYDYVVGLTTFTDRSEPSTPINVIEFQNQAAEGTTEKGKFATELTNIYAYTNAANFNYPIADTTNFRKEIYRTIGNGQLYYRADVDEVVADISNATTSYSDYSLDAFLVNQLSLYTTGGVADNSAPPISSHIHQANDIMYYAVKNRVYQSIPGDPDSVPGDFYDQFDETIIGISSTRSNVVAFGANKVYRLNGAFDELGRGGITNEVIFDRTGAVSAQSIVKADNGVFFAGKDGFYFTDGYQCMRVNNMERTFRAYTNTAAKRNSLQGAYDNISKKVYWTLTTLGGASPDTIWVLDCQFGIKLDDTPITTFTSTTLFKPTALAFYSGILHYGDSDGYVFQQTLGLNMDLRKVTSVAATLWEKDTVMWDYKGCNSDYGSAEQRKYFTRVTSQFEQQGTNVSAQIKSDADKGRIVNSLPVIRSRKLNDWGDSKLDWISSVYTAQAGQVVDTFRMFKGDGSLRSNFRALEFMNAYCVIVNSTDMGTLTAAVVAGTVYTATLTSLVATRKWPLYSVGYFIRIGGVDYPVTVRTSDSVVRIDTAGLAALSAGVKTSWELWGYPKNERIRFLGYTVSYAMGDEEETGYQGDVISAGTNA